MAADFDHTRPGAFPSKYLMNASPSERSAFGSHPRKVVGCHQFALCGQG
jgi:hypothetical protein